MEKEKTNLPKEIMELLIKKSKEQHDYVNPNFLQGISELLEGYYQMENDDVDKWIYDMWSC